ncbi:Uncharacterized protein Adt_31362 [Abeliophyllum distichum]|uniref:Uncharacterized protein n=1 Tax=Abeliophyllum distichum TaxID=126358 RepID=A0ABD1RDV7_9LAMI
MVPFHCRRTLTTCSQVRNEVAKVGIQIQSHPFLLSHQVFTQIQPKAARDGFCSEIQKLLILREKLALYLWRIGLGRAALHIAAEDDSLITHSSVPLLVDDFIERLDNLSMDYCSFYSSSFSSSADHFVQCLERYLYIDKVS